MPTILIGDGCQGCKYKGIEVCLNRRVKIMACADFEGEIKTDKPDVNRWPLNGYAPGGYGNKCCDCGKDFIGDKRAVRCLSCAEKMDKKPDENRCRRYDQTEGPICSICGIPHLDCSHGLISEMIIDGTAKAQEHYQGDVQPIEFMQSVLPTEAFIGYLQGNLIKYVSRLGKKDAVEKECDKIQQYAFWLSCAVRGEKIDPRK